MPKKEAFENAVLTKLDSIENRLEKVETRLDRVETKLENVDVHLDKVDVRLSSLEKTVEDLAEVQTFLVSQVVTHEELADAKIEAKLDLAKAKNEIMNHTSRECAKTF